MTCTCNHAPPWLRDPATLLVLQAVHRAGSLATGGVCRIKDVLVYALHADPEGPGLRLGKFSLKVEAETGRMWLRPVRAWDRAESLPAETLVGRLANRMEAARMAVAGGRCDPSPPETVLPGLFEWFGDRPHPPRGGLAGTAVVTEAGWAWPAHPSATPHRRPPWRERRFGALIPAGLVPNPAAAVLRARGLVRGREQGDQQRGAALMATIRQALQDGVRGGLLAEVDRATRLWGLPRDGDGTAAAEALLRWAQPRGITARARGLPEDLRWFAGHADPVAAPVNPLDLILSPWSPVDCNQGTPRVVQLPGRPTPESCAWSDDRADVALYCAPAETETVTRPPVPALR